MDTRIRKHETCVIGLPRCDYVFSSTRSCFIAYGYNDSPFEKTILCNLLTARGIEPVEAGGSLAPGQFAFCTKICSKIIQAQFCVVLINNEMYNGREIPNANVNMEYGLMLGFNKHVLPFQKSDQKLPFNVAGLDTTIYDAKSFESLAGDAIDSAIAATDQKRMAQVDLDQRIATFLLVKRMLFCPLLNDGEKNLFHLGEPLGFSLLSDFSGMDILYFGNFTAFSPDNVAWRVSLLGDILAERFSNRDVKLRLGMVNQTQVDLMQFLEGNVKIWVLVSSDADKAIVERVLSARPIQYDWVVFTLTDVSSAIG